MFGTRRSTVKGGADASFLSVVKAAAVKADVAIPTITAAENGECMRDRHGQRLHHSEDDDDDGDSAPIAQRRWFQASAKAVRMSVLEHLERDKARSQVSEQLRVWAADKVERYSQACRYVLSVIGLQGLPCTSRSQHARARWFGIFQAGSAPCCVGMQRHLPGTPHSWLAIKHTLRSPPNCCRALAG